MLYTLDFGQVYNFVVRVIFRAICATLLHRYTIKCVMGYKIMAERNMVNLTITMTREERKALKQIALDKDLTVSALLREWLKEYQAKEETCNGR